MKWMHHRVTKLFQPSIPFIKPNESKAELASRSYQLLVDNGIIHSSDTGMFTFLPLGMRVLNKLIQIVEEEMTSINGQRILLPSLTSTRLWKKSDRFEESKPELFILEDRHGKEYLLGPTFEEAISKLIAEVGPLFRKRLPLKVYQISSKWRDEMKPRLGLFRAREFIMKDMYTFDWSTENANATYQEVQTAYEKIFGKIGLPFIRIEADPGLIGGSVSHEYHYEADIGEDCVLFCKTCKKYQGNFNAGTCCASCNQEFQVIKSVEVGHTFSLGTKYSSPLKAVYTSSENMKKPLIMGCYGLGLTRMIATATDILSTDVELRWPLELAPYKVCIISFKETHKINSVSPLAQEVHTKLWNSNYDAIIDDRITETIGKRLKEAQRVGYPIVIVINKQTISPDFKVEVHNMYKSSFELVPLQEVIPYLENLTKNITTDNGEEKIGDEILAESKV
ncbi:hypothetical protein QAD02_006539 [Eretmocerus hayati]|uniref:Uncharacterized protein n=1 Tax=Eretmocerus hayati TaxID=131215 RepID=A0ACC2N194_9HYME|nr:hypothetical protein QAD02_006539 [Eretmocerus hayati]